MDQNFNPFDLSVKLVLTFKKRFYRLLYFQRHLPILCLSLRHKYLHCFNSIWRHSLCRGLCFVTSGLEMLKAHVWVKGFVLLHFIVSIKVWTRAPRKTNNNQQTRNYFVMFLVTNSFIKNCHTLYAGKNEYSSSLKIFSWCSNDKYWHNIPGKMSLYSTHNLGYFDYYKREMFNSDKFLMQTWSYILIVGWKALLSTLFSLSPSK